MMMYLPEVPNKDNEFTNVPDVPIKDDKFT